VSLWDSIDAIRAFAGEPVERARYYDEDPRYLLEFEPTVSHYDVRGAAVSDLRGSFAWDPSVGAESAHE
jgi:hypothetical protein